MKKNKRFSRRWGEVGMGLGGGGDKKERRRGEGREEKGEKKRTEEKWHGSRADGVGGRGIVRSGAGEQ